MAVYFIYIVVSQTSQFDIGNVLQTKHFTVGQCFYYNIIKFFCCLQTSFITDRILERLVSLFTERTRSSLHVLFSQHVRYIVRHQLILCHYIRLQPDTHRIIGTQYVGITDPRYTLYFRNQVDLCIVFQKFLVVTVFRIINGKNNQHGVLTFLGSHTDLRYFGRQQTLCHRHTVLNVYCCHIRVGSLFEIYGDIGRTVIGSI